MRRAALRSYLFARFWGAVGVFACLGIGTAEAATESVLFRFHAAAGVNLNSTLVADAAGNLYGTANSGGPPILERSSNSPRRYRDRPNGPKTCSPSSARMTMTPTRRPPD